MRAPLRRRMRWLAAGVLGSLGALLIAVLLIAWSGVYNVAASRGHWRIMEWALSFGMQNSVEARARFIDPPPLDDPDLVTLGAGHFHGGCAYCHGAPGVAISPIARHMLPPPPDLATATEVWKDRELFWIVKHGIKYTGMPAWVSQQRDDEIWAVVAFLKRLPHLDAQGYRKLAVGGLTTAPQSGRELAIFESAPDATTACARCHGAEGQGPASKLVPILHGQPREFLLAALQAFADGTRESGIMQPVASDLTPEAMERLAEFYSRLPPSRGGPAEAARIERGRVLATEGSPDARIPACLSCHGAGALPAYPRLAGQHAAYMTGRLRLWRNGYVAHTDTNGIMAPIARQLSEQQIDDVSAYFSAQPAIAHSGNGQP
jgi:cytochrome c553